MSIDPGLFPDVADALGIDSPAIVEKDVYAVLLLSLLAELHLETFELVFAGGTSLAKAHLKLFRMSEDIDIKLVPRDEVVAGMSKTALKTARKAVLTEIEAIINRSHILELDPVDGIVKRNEYRYAEFTVRYPRTEGNISALRPGLKLDVTASELYEPAVLCSVSSLYADVLKLPPEVVSFLVVSLHATISEKLVALLRRTAHVNRDPSRKDDETLVRHVYDLHMATSGGYQVAALRRLVKAVIQTDVVQFGNQHAEFVTNPADELLYGLGCLQVNPIHQDRYERFIGPLVYHDEPATWYEALQTVAELAQLLLPDGNAGS
ncbi:nucleotidyl transferase AbiEii/AbiGii toxin family protein [Halomonas sp. AOP13-D3-9]